MLQCHCFIRIHSMHREIGNKSSDAFTRIELLIVLTSVVLLGTVGLSVLGNTAARNATVVCANNLRQVGRAFNMWASDYGGENPWWVHHTEGGSYVRFNEPPPPTINVPGAGPRPSALRINPWFHFGFVSQELRTPSVLVCPTDRAKARAEVFSNNPTNGYFALAFQNRSTSYFIGIHALALAPSAMLSGDRSLKEDAFGNCPVNVGTISRIELNGFPKSWNTDLHPTGGNLLLNDGRVEEFSSDALTWFLDPRGQTAGNTHIVKPN